ncbi:MAG TPA: hypothetical protein VJ866_02150 [Pyrinomonadaceae bacterium]|nr:hypothetical protein [Pyrinomonadaceae bacterium]
MLLSELFIIYFAAAAPFGVSRFLSERSGGARTRPALRVAALAALAWPVTSINSLLRRAASRVEATDEVENSAPDSRAVERATRAAVNALRALEDLLGCEVPPVGADESSITEARHALFNARGSVERYSGLALACAATDAGAGPTPREMELCRIAGRAGDDLLVAGRCVHRRNAARLFAHRERARAELVRALADVRGVVNHKYAARHASGCTSRPRVEGAALLRTTLGDALTCVVTLASLFEDDATADAVNSLLDEGRREVRQESRADSAARGGSREGGESCMTPAVPTAFVTPNLGTTTSRGG